MRQLTPEALASEFKKIYSETVAGYISKLGLGTFVATRKAGEPSSPGRTSRPRLRLLIYV